MRGRYKNSSYDIKPHIHIAALAASLLLIVHRGSCHRSAGGVRLLAC